jgi:hypothetical protein
MTAGTEAPELALPDPLIVDQGFGENRPRRVTGT